MIPALQDAAASGWFGVIRMVLLVAAILFSAGALVRMYRGKGDEITKAISASLTILLLYFTTILLYLFLPSLRNQLVQLPFVYTDGPRFLLRNLTELSEQVLFGSLVRLGLLAFLVNLLESLLPEGEGFLKWCLWKAVTVVMALSLYNFLILVLEAAAPGLFTHWAKWLILGCWTFILLSGALHWLTTLVLTVINPVVGLVYAFFFSSTLGKQFSKSILTTVILVILAAILNYYDMRVFSFDSMAISSWGPPGLILMLALFLFGKFL